MARELDSSPPRDNHRPRVVPVRRSVEVDGGNKGRRGNQVRDRAVESSREVMNVGGMRRNEHRNPPVSPNTGRNAQTPPEQPMLRMLNVLLTFLEEEEEWRKHQPSMDEGYTVMCEDLFRKLQNRFRAAELTNCRRIGQTGDNERPQDLSPALSDASNIHDRSDPGEQWNDVELQATDDPCCASNTEGAQSSGNTPVPDGTAANDLITASLKAPQRLLSSLTSGKAFRLTVLIGVLGWIPPRLLLSLGHMREWAFEPGGYESNAAEATWWHNVWHTLKRDPSQMEGYPVDLEKMFLDQFPGNQPDNRAPPTPRRNKAAEGLCIGPCPTWSRKPPESDRSGAEGGHSGYSLPMDVENFAHEPSTKSDSRERSHPTSHRQNTRLSAEISAAAETPLTYNEASASDRKERGETLIREKPTVSSGADGIATPWEVVKSVLGFKSAAISSRQQPSRGLSSLLYVVLTLVVGLLSLLKINYVRFGLRPQEECRPVANSISPPSGGESHAGASRANVQERSMPCEEDNRERKNLRVDRPAQGDVDALPRRDPLSERPAPAQPDPRVRKKFSSERALPVEEHSADPMTPPRRRLNPVAEDRVCSVDRNQNRLQENLSPIPHNTLSLLEDYRSELSDDECDNTAWQSLCTSRVANARVWLDSSALPSTAPNSAVPGRRDVFDSSALPSSGSCEQCIPRSVITPRERELASDKRLFVSTDSGEHGTIRPTLLGGGHEQGFVFADDCVERVAQADRIEVGNRGRAAEQLVTIQIPQPDARHLHIKRSRVEGPGGGSRIPKSNRFTRTIDVEVLPENRAPGEATVIVPPIPRQPPAMNSHLRQPIRKYRE